MNANTAQKILATNHQFYQTFAVQFAATRQRLQPGVYRLVEESRFADSILDLGCGNSELAHSLYKRGYTGLYTGLDFSQGLLEQARQELPQQITNEGEHDGSIMQAGFYLQDLTQTVWTVNLPRKTYAVVVAFAVMHHLPGDELRQSFLANVRQRLAPGGVFIHSNWQFMNSSRLRERIQPWERAGLHSDEVDEGDYLLDWRSGGSGLRYVHHFSHAELQDAASHAGFQVLETFSSDGETGNLSLYQIWQVQS